MCPSVTVLADDLIEGDEKFEVKLALVTNGPSLRLGNSITAVTLTDNDGTDKL